MGDHCIRILLFLFTVYDVSKSVQAADGGWSGWSNWSSCTVSCGQGQRRRYRTCDSPLPTGGGKWCTGNPFRSADCFAPVECPVDGKWSNWGIWTACSVSCGEGVMHRYRTCDNPQPQYRGKQCEGSSQESHSCTALGNCPRDGQWSSWSKWSSCSVSCGDEGTRNRYRSCNNPSPSAGGMPCPGPNRGAKECSADMKCAVNGQWSEWNEWTPCSVSCGSGERRRWRACDNPPPQHSGLECDETIAGEMQSQSCDGRVRQCKVDGKWSEWGRWGSCNSPDCHSPSNASVSLRQRSCNNPLPLHGGSMCQGNFLEAGLCDQPDNCKVDGGWSDWSSWSCTKDLAKRYRQCDNPPPTNDGKICPQTGTFQFYSRNDDEDSYRNVCMDASSDDEDFEGMFSGSGARPDEEQ